MVRISKFARDDSRQMGIFHPEIGRRNSKDPASLTGPRFLHLCLAPVPFQISCTAKSQFSKLLRSDGLLRRLNTASLPLPVIVFTCTFFTLLSCILICFICFMSVLYSSTLPCSYLSDAVFSYSVLYYFDTKHFFKLCC